jgi:hypothetical protein
MGNVTWLNGLYWAFWNYVLQIGNITRLYGYNVKMPKIIHTTV